MASAKYLQQYGNLFKVIYNDNSIDMAYPMGSNVWISSDFTLQEMGNQIKIQARWNNTSLLAIPLTSGMWVAKTVELVTPPPGPDPGTPGGLIDTFTPNWGITGDWEDHWDYSRGGTDWGMGVGSQLRAPAAGTIVNYGNTDGAGLKSMLVFDQAFPRKIAASGTLMNGVYREHPTAPAVAFMFQHLSGQKPAQHYQQNEVVAISGNTGQSSGPHLHGHLLAGATIGAPRLDFMKFV